MSPLCQECNKEFKIINSNHLKGHNMTLDEYIEKYGNPNSGSFKNTRTSNVKSTVAKASKPKKALTHGQIKTLDEIYELEEAIEVPDKFICLIQSNIDKFDEMIKQIYEYRMFDLDTETTGLDMFEDRVTDIIITIGNEPTYRYNYYIPLFKVDYEEKPLEGLLDTGYVLKALKPIMEDPTIGKGLFYNYFDEIMLWSSFGIELKGVVWDGLIAAKVLNENEPSHKLKDLYRAYLYKDEKDPQIKALGVDTFEEQFGKIKFYRIPIKVSTCYGAKDGYMTRRLREFQKTYIDSVGNLKNVFYNIEMPLLPVLIEMRKEGIGADLDYGRELQDELEAEQEVTHAKLIEILGDINMNSPKQLAEVLYDKLKMPDISKSRSTKAAVLEELAERGHDVAELLIDYKKKSKLIGTYLEGLPQMISKKTGRIHTRFNQLGARTGRFSSSDPNLQNIPAKFGKMRKIFRAKPGHVLISADYSQIEPRLLAHISNDPVMIQTYIEGGDLYSSMAAHVFSLVAEKFATDLSMGSLDIDHIASPVYRQLLSDEFVYQTGETKVDKLYKEHDQWDYKELSPENCSDGTLYRKFMKTLLLGMMYSMSEKGLASKLNISDDDAFEIMNFFFKRFPNIRKHMKSIEAFCYENGYIETPSGRKRRLPDIWSEEFWLRSKTKRQVLNSEIQGWAADVMKLSIIAVGGDDRIRSLGGKLLLTVHDELILECPKEHAIKIAGYMIDDMVGVVDIKVPMKVDAEIYTDGRWYGDSIKVKKKGNESIIIGSEGPIKEEDIDWQV